MANKALHSWKIYPFDWWQCQLNFTLWCATAGPRTHSSEVSSPFTCTTPQDGFSCRCASPSPEIPPTPGTITDTTTEPSNAFAMNSAHFRTRTGDRRWIMGVKALEATASTWNRQAPIATHEAQGPFLHLMDAIRHNHDISRASTTFVLDKSNSFTQAGVVRLNDSIRTYVWAILGSQA